MSEPTTVKQTVAFDGDRFDGQWVSLEQVMVVVPVWENNQMGWLGLMVEALHGLWCKHAVT
jgi:hypothetical protein